MNDLTNAPHWVYEIWSKQGGGCIYVGMTCDIARRLREHSRERLWREPTFEIRVTPVHGREAARSLEGRRIGELLPTQNVHSNPRGQLHWCEPRPTARARKEESLRRLRLKTEAGAA